MIADKLIKITEKQELNITGATLLSIEEYNQAKKYIPLVNRAWWLSSRGRIDVFAACVFGSDVIDIGSYVDRKLGVRPALTIKLESSNLQIGDKFKFAGCIFTIVSDTYALCDSIIGECAFRENWRAKNANNYKTSDVKKWLENWYSNQIIEADKERIVNMTKETIIKSALTFLVQKQIEQGSHGYAMDEEENKCSWSEVLEWLNQFDNVTSGIECDVLNKIRAEFISLYPNNYAGEPKLGGSSCEFSLNQVLNVIDKYKTESEDKK